MEVLLDASYSITSPFSARIRLHVHHVSTPFPRNRRVDLDRRVLRPGCVADLDRRVRPERVAALGRGVARFPADRRDVRLRRGERFDGRGIRGGVPR
jgi:hypothetical protein